MSNDETSSAAQSRIGPPAFPRTPAAGQFRPDWYRVTLASIGDAVITTDTQDRVTFLNPAAESLTGWTLDEAVGQPLDRAFRVISEDGRRPAESPSVRALRDGVAVEAAQKRLLIARDGTERPIGDRAVPLLNASGDIDGAVVVFRDVSGRRKVEQEVKDALAYAGDIVATLREPFMVLDADLRVQTANSAFYRNFEVSAQETEGRYIYELGNGQWDIPRLRVLLEEVLPRDLSFADFEVDHTFPGLGRKVMLLNARRVVSTQGRPALILLAIEDVTSHRNAASAIEASEVRYRRLFETAKDGILILDAVSGRIIDANPFMSELLGYPHDEFLGRELWEIGLLPDRAKNEGAVRALQEHGYVRYEHLPLQSHNGKRVDVEFVCNVYSVEDRRVAQCNIRDIGVRVRLEHQLQEQAAELADLNRRKDEFLAMLSHELRNPLAPITNAVQLLKMQQGNENLIQQQARTIIARQVKQLKGLIDDLMEVSRIATGRVRLRLEHTAVAGIVHAAAETARPGIDQRKHELTIELPDEPIWLHADASRLEQVLVNLLTNAAKYTDVGGRITVSAEQVGDGCVLRVSDTGIGIAPELLPRVFDLFTQAERLQDRSEGGLGIGLSLVQRITELHGGTVGATSVQGTGSEFTVRLPLAKMSERETPAATIAPASPATGHLRVMVIDDNVDMAESLAMLVKADGHHVRTAYDGEAALQLAALYRPDAVLLDIGLPGMDGREVARRLRQDPGTANSLLIALTGYGRDEDHQRSREEGFDHHLVKPPDLARVRSLLASAAAVVA